MTMGWVCNFVKWPLYLYIVKIFVKILSFDHKQMQKIEFWPSSTSTCKYDILIGNNTLFQVSQGTATI